jgi:serine protease Do
MNRIFARAARIGVLLALVASVSLEAQESKEQIKKRILARVEEFLKREEERVLREIEQVIDEELKKRAPGDKKLGFLGAQLAALGDEDREALKLNEGEGVLVASVTPEGPAAKAGVRDGDVVTAIDGKKVGAVQPMVEAIQKAGAGTTVTLRLLRGAEQKDVKVELGERPGAAPPPKPEEREEGAEQAQAAREQLRARLRAFMNLPAELGVRAEDLSPEARAELKLEKGAGVRVAEVRPGSPAQSAGLAKGDVIVAIDGKPVEGERGLADALHRARAGQVLKLDLVSGGQRRTVEVRLAEKR